MILTTAIYVSNALLLWCTPGLDGRDPSVIQYQWQSHFGDSYKPKDEAQWDGVSLLLLTTSSLTWDDNSIC